MNGDCVDHRLTTSQMAEFVTFGCVRFDEIVPKELTKRARSEVEQLNAERLLPEGMKPPHSATPLADCYPEPSAIGEYLRLPEIQGIIQSFVGSDPLFDHDWTHFIPAKSTYMQPLHVDAVTDSTDPAFDVQLFWFLNDVEEGGGGTRFVPGTHLRRVLSSGLDRYQHIAGEQQFVGKAGTVIAFHHGLWHAGQPNPSGVDRWMHKTRLNPTEPQVRLWNTADLDDMQNPSSDHIFARMQAGSVADTFRTWHSFHGVTDHRNDQIQRAKLWRYLTGDDQYDVDYYLSRLEGRSSLADGGLADGGPITPLSASVGQGA